MNRRRRRKGGVVIMVMVGRIRERRGKVEDVGGEVRRHGVCDDMIQHNTRKWIVV